MSAFGGADPAHPTTLFAAAQPHGEGGRQKRDGAGDQPVPMLCSNILDLPPARRIQAAVRERPVGHREARLLAGDERSGGDQKDHAARQEDGEPVPPAVRL